MKYREVAAVQLAHNDGENMEEIERSSKSIDAGTGVNVTELNEASWQRWVNKGKEQDARRRKRFYRVLWFLIPAVIVLASWFLGFRQ